jgi:hypothetical protein
MSIQPYQPPAAVEVIDAVQDKAVRRLTEWAQSAQAAHQIAQTLVQTTFVPDSFRGKPGEATAAILAGLEVGLQPMAALRSFDVIQGQAAPRAITLRAIVQSFGHDMLLVESTGTRCKMRGRRKGTSEWQEVVWTLDRAKGLGLLNKHNWMDQPQAMLGARATSELARLIASDAILGLGYSAEEVADGGTPTQAVNEQTVDATPTGTRRMSRRPKNDDGADTPEPPVAPVEDRHSDEEPAPSSITPDQSKKLHASFNDLGITDREQRLAYCTNLIGRDVTTSNDLTKDEASRVIDALEQDLVDAEPAELPMGGEQA